MLQIANLEEYTASDIPRLLEEVRPILNKRIELHRKYSRGATDSKVMFSENNLKTVLPFEKFLTDLATGYLSGDPTYTVDVAVDSEKKRILEETLDKSVGDTDYQDGMNVIIEYITKYNDDATENHDLIHDILEMTSCYEIIYENEDNEIVYSKYSPLQTVATWDYDIPANLTGLVRVWEEHSLFGNPVTKVELTDVNGTRVYSVSGEAVIEEDRNNHNWGDVPAICVETDYAIFEGCEDVIQAYQQLIQNMRNTYQYNDADCKLMLSGYSPENSATIVNEQGQTVPNPARQIEDSVWVNAKTIYVGDGGSVSWLIKNVDATGCTTILKTYVDLMFQLAGIPNTSDLAFNSTDLNASAIDRKFYIMNMSTQNIVAQLKKAYLRRWELIFNRINLKKGTKFDFRDITIDLPKNLPSNNDEMIDALMKLQGLISNQTIVEKLGFNYMAENEKMMNEAEEKLDASMALMEKQNEYTGADREVLEQDREPVEAEENSDLQRL